MSPKYIFIYYSIGFSWGFPGGVSGKKKKKKSPCQCRRCKRCKFDPWVRKTPWSRKWYPTPLFLPGKFHGQRNLVGYSPWRCKEHGGSTEHIINLWKINLEYRMGFIIRKSKLKSVF